MMKIVTGPGPGPDLDLSLSLTKTIEKAKSYRKFKIRWRSTCKKVAALKLGPDMTKVAIYMQEGGDLRTKIVTS